MSQRSAGCRSIFTAGRSGAARLGLLSALISRVGGEHMGRYGREPLTREGVESKALVADPARLTALVILDIRDRETFPLIFYRLARQHGQARARIATFKDLVNRAPIDSSVIQV
jgi:sugar/nucleoside kinase (ribokinase family)